jgi:hypothetical protein
MHSQFQSPKHFHKLLLSKFKLSKKDSSEDGGKKKEMPRRSPYQQLSGQALLFFLDCFLGDGSQCLELGSERGIVLKCLLLLDVNT